MRKRRHTLKKRVRKLEHKYAVRHKTRGFIGYVMAYNIAVVRCKYPEEKGYTVHRRK